MLTPLILFLGLTVATAVIAHWSDNLGKKLGKKRVSLLGLRPRTTATILTVASSWGIMLFTLVALLVAVKPLRTALFSYDRESQKAASDRLQANLDRKRASGQIEAARERLKLTQIQYDAADGQLKTAQGALKKANQEVKASQKAAQEAEKRGKQRADAARARTAEAERDAAQAQSRVAAAQKSVVAAQKLLLAARRQEAEAVRGEQVAQGEKRDADLQTKRAQAEGEAARKVTRVALANRNAALADLQKTNKSLSDTKKQLRDSSSKLRFAQQSLGVARQDLEQTTLATKAFAASDTPVKVGQTFAARTLDANQSPDVLVRQLRELLKQGRESFAESEDLAPTPSFPPGATLQIYPLQAKDDNGKPVLLEGERLLQRFARDIRIQRDADLISVRLVAARNYLSVENRIGVLFVFVPIKPAFFAGEILASATIDGAKEDWRIWRELQDLLNLGQQRAQNLGVKPPLPPDEPYFYAAGTNVRIFAALRAIEASKQRVQVNLVTFKALSTVEPLQVRFEIEGLGAPDAPIVAPTATPTETPAAPGLPTS